MNLSILHKKTEKTTLALISAIWAIVAVFPLWMIIVILFSPPGAAALVNFRIIPTFLSAGLASISTVLKEGPFLNGYMVSLTYAALQTFGVLLIVSMAAFEFSFFEFPLKRSLFVLALSSLMVPQAVIIIPLFKVLVLLKWLNTFAGLAIPGMASATALFILTQFMEKLPKELLDSADIDGAPHFMKYYKIVVPMTKNALVTAGILTFLGAWGNFYWPLVVVTKMEMYPVSLIVNFFTSATSYKTVEVQLAAFFMAAVLPIALYFIFQRSIVRGITTSGIKG
jgi:multiple sugar transport system permease protein